MNDRSGEFIVFITSPDLIGHLKAEVEHFYPDFKMGYNRPPLGMITYKNSGRSLGLRDISNLKITFARRVLHFKDKSVLSHIPAMISKEKGLIHYYTLSNELPLLNFDQEINRKANLGEKVVNLIHLEKDLFYICEHIQNRFCSRSPNAVESITLPEEAPSRAYLKTAEAFTRFSYRPKPNTVALELGAAPGGSIYYLLSQGCNVTAVDSALLDESLNQFTNLKHVHKSIQMVTRSDLDLETTLLILDMNLKATQSFNETMRVIGMLPNLSTLFLTLKAPETAIVYKLDSYKDLIRKAGFKDVTTTTLLSHKREFLLFATR